METLVEDIEEQVKKAIEEAREVIGNENEVDPNKVCFIQARLSALQANVGQIYRKYEYRANTWKQYNHDMQQVVVSLRKIIDTLNIERRNP